MRHPKLLVSAEASSGAMICPVMDMQDYGADIPTSQDFYEGDVFSGTQFRSLS